MASLNSCAFIGNVARVETRYLPNGDAVSNLSLAVNEKYKSKSGEMVEHCEFVRVSFFGALAGVIEKYVHKGDPLYISGSMRTRKYADKDGVEKYATEIRGDRLQMLGGKPEGSKEPQSASQAEMNSQKPGSFDDMGDNIPF